MLRTSALAILVLSELCLAIRVPVVWSSDSEVNHEEGVSANEQKPIPVEYFTYTAEKPQFAVDIAEFHGVQSPEQHYKAYPVRPYTGKEKPNLGKHKLHDESNPVFKPYQEFTQNEALKYPASPTAINYEVYHPYKAEEPALQQIYKDPVLEKIRNDIRDSQHRLQTYESEAGKPNITEDEYLESPEQTDRKKFPIRNVPVRYEIHRPMRRPVYYRTPPKYSHRENVLNHKFKHPWNQHNAKIRPVHYQPIKNHIHRLRQHHALKYDDERNEYPQVPSSQNYAEPVEGYDIYERGKDKYVQLRNNVDESINKAVQENRPTIYQKLELQNNGDRTDSDEDEEEFIPIKNYAQVRKTETTKHLPKEAAFDDAENVDEIRNAPRLREAVKSTKAQTVYTEEGYEDAAYDHAGEQKHASEVEGHGGYLKEKEISGGKYKIPTVVASYQDGGGNEYRDLTEHGEKWKNNDKDNEEETESEDYSENEHDHSIEADVYEDVTGERNKREHNADVNTEIESNQSNETNPQHEVNKRETKFKVPEINLNSTYLTEDEITKISKQKTEPKKDNIKDKYPYYFKNLKAVHRDSPLRYAENLQFIPKKTKGGTEFYDSRSTFECSEVDDNVDALPEKLKKNGHPDSDQDDNSEDNSKKNGQANFDHLKENPRLKGLGDKIDCFKSKFFGENPLDSPFFKEDIIANPEPIVTPNLSTFKLKDPQTGESRSSSNIDVNEKFKEGTKTDEFFLLDKLRNGQKELQESLIKANEKFKSTLTPPLNLSIVGNKTLSQQENMYSDLFDTIKKLQKPLVFDKIDIQNKLLDFSSNVTPNNVTYSSYQNKEEVTKQPITVRKKRSAPFVYEPYKIIRDSQVQDSKKTTTTSNISPLIKQLQSSKVVDRATQIYHDKEQPVKRNVVTRTYKDIGRKERKNLGDEDSAADSFVDVNTDKRRGEPRYELKYDNHKSEYTPVENKTAMTIEDYKNATNKIEQKGEDKVKDKMMLKNVPQSFSTQRRTTARPYFDVSEFLPNFRETQKTSASSKVKKIIKTTTLAPKISHKKISEKPTLEKTAESNENYEEYDDEEEILITTTTSKPYFTRRKLSVPPKAAELREEDDEEEEELPKLRLITRFRNHQADIDDKMKEKHIESPPVKEEDDDGNIEAPKYREKKKKSSKSTVVTDTKTYGDDDGDSEDDMRKDEVDAFIGVKHDMDEYMPHYEKKTDPRSKERENESSNTSDEDEEYDDDDSDEEEDGEDFDDEEEDNQEQTDDEPESEQKIVSTTTPEPTKRTLVRTTEAPPSTTEARIAKLELKPIVMKKTIEIHKELHANKSSPHVSQFKQDIKEVEIIKEMPSTKSSPKKLQKNLEALQLYKDDNLAKDINKLGGVEVFKENLDIKKGPRHGGNYRSAKIVKLQGETRTTTQKPRRGGNSKVTKDAETSQSKNTKLVDMDDELPARKLHGGNLKSVDESGNSKSISTTGRNAKIELDYIDEVVTESTHRENLKDRRERRRKAKLNELNDHDEHNKNKMHGGNFQSYDDSIDDDSSPHHRGGSYRNGKLTSTNARNKAAGLLNSFVQAVPILTTTPSYILDPSKRMYYYVDAEV